MAKQVVTAPVQCYRCRGEYGDIKSVNGLVISKPKGSRFLVFLYFPRGADLYWVCRDCSREIQGKPPKPLKESCDG